VHVRERRGVRVAHVAEQGARLHRRAQRLQARQGVVTERLPVGPLFALKRKALIFQITGAGAFAASNPADKIIDLQHALKAQYRPGAAWVTSDSVLAKVRQMKDGTGAFYLWQPDPLSGFGGRLLGNPVEIDDNMPALGAASYSLAFGNFRQAYVVVNRSGTVVIRDNITSKGKTKFNFRRRFGGGVQNFEALKLMQFAE
jgi:HK97 family phage major capsid protein